MIKRNPPIRDGTNNTKKNLLEFLKDKDGNHSLREIVILVSLVCVLISWIGEQFFKYTAPSYMFYAFVSMIGAGCFGYSLEKNSTPPNNLENNSQNKIEKEE